MIVASGEKYWGIESDGFQQEILERNVSIYLLLHLSRQNHVSKNSYVTSYKLPLANPHNSLSE